MVQQCSFYNFWIGGNFTDVDFTSEMMLKSSQALLQSNSKIISDIWLLSQIVGGGLGQELSRTLPPIVLFFSFPVSYCFACPLHSSLFIYIFIPTLIMCISFMFENRISNAQMFDCIFYLSLAFSLEFYIL